MATATLRYVHAQASPRTQQGARDDLTGFEVEVEVELEVEAENEVEGVLAGGIMLPCASACCWDEICSDCSVLGVLGFFSLCVPELYYDSRTSVDASDTRDCPAG